MSSPEVYFRVVSPFVGTAVESKAFIAIPIGSIIEIRYAIGDPGLVEIRVNDERLLAFRRDIQERTEPIDERARAARLGIRG